MGTAEAAIITQPSTLDPLLVNIFGVDPPSTTTVKVPKPKPVFNDGQKLDNSRDWEKVKVAQPEEVITNPTSPKEATETPVETTTNTAHMIEKEINSLEQDIKQNEQILSWLNKVAVSSNGNSGNKRR